jgi:hypothetical protein
MMENDFRARCDALSGIVQFNEEGALMQCVEPETSLDAPLIIYFNEFTPNEERAYGIVVERNDTEQNRLATYFAIVYEATPLVKWQSLSLPYLTLLWNNLELYYILPDDITPNTPIPSRRPKNEPTFYRIPQDVVLQQKYLYTLSDAAPDNAYMEVIHYGNLNVQLQNPPPNSFTGTYFYKATGSGAAISVGRKSLAAWNKIHALILMGVSPDEIYTNSGPRFKNVIVNRQRLSNTTFDESLKFVISQLVEGKSIRRTSSGELQYLGLGENGDAFLATTAVSQGYTSIQLVRESEFLPEGSMGLVPPVGFEIIILVYPQAASSLLQTDLRTPIYTWSY